MGQDDSVSANTGFDGSSGDSYGVYACIRYIALENCEMSHAWHEDIVKAEQYSASPEAGVHQRSGDRIALVTFVISKFHLFNHILKEKNRMSHLGLSLKI